MRWLFHPLLMLVASSTESELAHQIEFLKAENQMLRKRLPSARLRTTSTNWSVMPSAPHSWRRTCAFTHLLSGVASRLSIVHQTASSAYLSTPLQRPDTSYSR